MKGPSRHLARTVVVHDFKVSVEDNSFQATDVNNKYKNIRKGKCCRRNLISCVDSKKKVELSSGNHNLEINHSAQGDIITTTSFNDIDHHVQVTLITVRTNILS